MAELPPGSSWLNLGSDVFHVRHLSPDEAPLDSTTIVLLSGPSGRWHSDSAWFALLQPMLATQFNTLAIDRAGHGFGQAPSTSYQAFGRALPTLLRQLKAESVVLVGFASANLAIAHYVNSEDAKHRLKGVLLIDPDALGPKTLEFYASQARDFQHPELVDYVRSGRYDERAQQARQKERDEVARLIPPSLQHLMDWTFYDAVTRARTERERIVQRFLEIARYDHDVYQAAAITWPNDIATLVWDTDFESADIERDPANSALRAWRDDSSAWFAEQSGRCHLRSDSREHLATFAEASQLVVQIQRLATTTVNCHGDVVMPKH